MKIRTIEQGQFIKSEWTGGTTTQLFISPENAELGRRNFDIRISSASFTTTSSKFSDFSGYTRFILPLKGTLRIRHPNREEITLSPYQVYRFDGGAETDSENSIDCIDFNLIVRDGLEANLMIWKDGDTHLLRKDHVYFFYAERDFSVETIKKESEDSLLRAGRLYILSPSEDVTAKTDVRLPPVVVCEVKKE